MQNKITTCLWFDRQGEEAAKFYTSIFRNSKIGRIAYYGENSPGGPKGTVMTVEFELDGNRFLALNGGLVFTFSAAISLVVNCDTQAEIDEMWDKLSAGGKAVQCGWLTDKYGVSWQIVPTVLPEMVAGKDPAKAQRVMDAIMKMVKLDMATLERAYEGK